MHVNPRPRRQTSTALVILFSVQMSSPAWAQAPSRSSADFRASAADHAAAAATEQAASIRTSDSLLNGALIGAGAAIATGLFLCTRTEPWENCRDDVGPMLRIGAIGAGIGIAIDALIRKRHPSPSTPDAASLSAAPMVGHRNGLQLSLKF